MDRPGTCIILDKKYNIANSSCHFGSYGSIWTGPSPKKYMDLRSFGPYNIFFGDGPVDILPYDPQCHELFAIYEIYNSGHNIYISHKANFFVKKVIQKSFLDQFCWHIRIQTQNIIKFFVIISIIFGLPVFSFSLFKHSLEFLKFINTIIDFHA